MRKSPPSQNVDAPILIHLCSQSDPVSVSGYSPHPSPLMRINPGDPSPGTDMAGPVQPSIPAIPFPYTIESTAVPLGSARISEPPEFTSQGEAVRI